MAVGSALGQWSASYSDPGVSGLADIKTVSTGSCSSSWGQGQYVNTGSVHCAQQGLASTFSTHFLTPLPILSISKIPSSCFIRFSNRFFLFFVDSGLAYILTPPTSPFLLQGKDC